MAREKYRLTKGDLVIVLEAIKLASEYGALFTVASSERVAYIVDKLQRTCDG